MASIFFIFCSFLILSFQVSHPAPLGTHQILNLITSLLSIKTFRVFLGSFQLIGAIRNDLIHFLLKSTCSVISTSFISHNPLNFYISKLSSNHVSSARLDSFIRFRSEMPDSNLQNSSSNIRSHLIGSIKKDKSCLISSFNSICSHYLTSPLWIFSCQLAQTLQITIDRIGSINLSTFNNVSSSSPTLILSILLFEYSQFIFSCLFKSFLLSSPRFGQNPSIFSCRVLFSRITSPRLIDSSKLNSSNLFGSSLLGKSTIVFFHCFKHSTVEPLIQVLLFFLNVCQQCFPNLLICSPIFPTSRKSCRSWFLSSQAFQLFWKQTLYDKLVKTICLPQDP